MAKAMILFFDSVTGDVPVLIRENNLIDIIPIEDLGSRKSKWGKRKIQNIEVYSEGGFTKINSVFSHEVSKPFYEITTFEGYVKVSPDHSIFLEDGTLVKGSQLKVTDKIKQVKFPKVKERKTITNDLAWLLGFFCADGCTSRGKRAIRWSIYNNNRKLLRKAQKIVLKTFGIKTEIKEYEGERTVPILAPSGNNLQRRGFSEVFGKFFDKYCYTKRKKDKWKKVPIQVLNGTKEIKKAFINGYFKGDGYKAKWNDNYGSKSFPLLMGIWFLLKSLGKNLSLSRRNDKDFIRLYTVKRGKNPRNKINKIIKKNNPPKSIFLYDIETNSNTFCAGIGLNLLHNSKNQARLMKKKIEDGCVEIEGKQFVIDASYPLLVKTWFGYKPLYICKWSDVTPAENTNPNKIEVFKRVDPKFKGEFKITPEILRKMMNLKILGNMIKTKKPTGGFIFLIIGLIVGALILYSLFALNLIPTF